MSQINKKAPKGAKKYGGRMRKLLGLLVAAVFVVTASSLAFANGIEKSTKTARVTFTGEGKFQWELLVKNVSDNATVTEIEWTGAKATDGSGWQTADQYVQIISTVTDADAYIRVYTDNKKGVEFPYTGTADEFLGGLVSKADPTADPLSMAWMMKDSTATASQLAVNPLNVSTDSVNGYSSSYFLDKSNYDFNLIEGTPGVGAGPTPYVNNVDYSTIISAKGWKATSAPTGGLGDTVPKTPTGRFGSGNGTFALYIGADFGRALPTPGGNEYGCDALIIEGTTEIIVP